MPRRVLVFGTFDILHPGHVQFLSRAARYGSVTVALTPDRLVTTYKGLPPLNSYGIRQARLLCMASVADVQPADDAPNSYSILKSTKPGTIVLGYDQAALRATIIEKLREFGLLTRVITESAYREDVYQSSKLRTLADRQAALRH